MTVDKLNTIFPVNIVMVKLTNHFQSTWFIAHGSIWTIDWQTLFSWLLLRLSKFQSPTTVLFRPALNPTITQYELLILLGLSYLLSMIHGIQTPGSSKLTSKMKSALNAGVFRSYIGWCEPIEYKMHQQCSLGTCKWVSASLLASCEYQLNKAHLSFGDCVLDLNLLWCCHEQFSSFPRFYNFACFAANDVRGQRAVIRNGASCLWY